MVSIPVQSIISQSDPAEFLVIISLTSRWRLQLSAPGLLGKPSVSFIDFYKSDSLSAPRRCDRLAVPFFPAPLDKEVVLTSRSRKGSVVSVRSPADPERNNTNKICATARALMQLLMMCRTWTCFPLEEQNTLVPGTIRGGYWHMTQKDSHLLLSLVFLQPDPLSTSHISTGFISNVQQEKRQLGGTKKTTKKTFSIQLEPFLTKVTRW